MLEQKIEKIVAPILADHKARLVMVEFKSNILTIMVEGEDGSNMGVDDFAKMHADISPAMEVEDPISGAYRLEISSPGIDRPLIRAEDYEKFMGFDAKIELKTPQNGQKRFRGYIKSYKEGVITLDAEDKGEFELAHAGVLKAKLVMSDRLMKFTKDLNKGS